jgi:hypothetical protein
MSLDLLTWPEIADARAAVASAHAEQVAAQRRWRYAPHGEKIVRLRALQTAVQRSLTAERVLTDLVARL